MHKENGHEWENKNPQAKCENCQMVYGHYLSIKEVQKRHPKRKELQDRIKCAKTKQEEPIEE